MEKWFSRDVHFLEQVFAFFDGFAASVGAGPPEAFPLRLAIEEVFVNMAMHNAGGAGTIALALAREDGRLVAVLRDPDSDPYDITQHVGPDVQAALEERTVGGLGLHLVNHLLDEVCYEYQGRETTIRLAKNFAPDVPDGY